MSDGSPNKVLKNTIALYVRMIVLTIISLFTFRIVFQMLGASDFGTYNVVGGFVTMFAFVSGTMIISSQRYFAIGLASDDWNQLNKAFSINLVIYAVLALVILALAETAGLWFVFNMLNVDYERITAVLIVYETSIIIFLIGFFVSPFLALLVADENLLVYSWISVIEGVLKVAVACFLYILNGDKLIIYSFLLLAVSIIINGFYLVYCLKKYKKLKFKLCRDKEEYRSMFSFINWNFIGAVAAVGKNQGINIIVNIFFGTVVNAARAVAYQINGVISSFAQNFMKAVDPRITKKFATGDPDSFISIIYTASKISYYLLLFICLPFMLNAEYVLVLWLGELPEYTVIFTILALVDALILSITDPILTGVQAVGKIKIYQLSVGIISLSNLPIAYFFLRISDNPVLPFIVAIVLDALITVGRLVNFKMLYMFSILKYCKKIFLPAVLVTFISVIADYCMFSGADSFLQLILNVLGSIIIMSMLIYFIGLNKKERRFIKDLLPFMKQNYDTGL